MKTSTDLIMKQVWLKLVEDFSPQYGYRFFEKPRKALLSSIQDFREYEWPARSQAPPYLFKVAYQLENLFKRYRFQDDAYSDEQLTQLALKKFVETQERIATPMALKPSGLHVLREARSIVSAILGDYDRTEHLEKSRFGKHACLGTPKLLSYLDCKIVSSPITGSWPHLEFLSDALEGDSLLSDAMLNESGVGTENAYLPCDHINLVLVPKSYKSLRSMMPDTLAGGFYTAGLGRVLQDRLARTGLDIRRLQQRHRNIVRDSSRDRRFVTADLSAASDSLTLELLRRLLPAKWYRVVTCGRARTARWKDREIYLTSTVTMGLGQTFPLQTLVFYSLIKAIGKLVGGRAFVSVYGDDLIYSRHLHKYVKSLFPQFHLLLNADKTYAEDYFRESCGSDFYRGIDVRPFQPEGVCRDLDGPNLTVFLHKLINGLALRWTNEEIPSTRAFLIDKLIENSGQLYQVPPSFPDGSGIKVDVIQCGEIWHPVLYNENRLTPVFKYLLEVNGLRSVKTQTPFYWESLRSAAQGCDCELAFGEPDSTILKWRKTPKPEFVWVRRSEYSYPENFFEDKHTRKKLRKMEACVTRKGSSRSIEQTGTATSWT